MMNINETIRLVKGYVPLHTSTQIYNFISKVCQYELYATPKDFELIPPKDLEGGDFVLQKPFIDYSIAMSDIKEFGWVIGLNSQREALFVDLLSIGDINKTLMEPWQAYRASFLTNTAGIVLCHNHPTGNLNPSDGDMRVTKAVVHGAIKLHRLLYDHLIFHETNGFFSMADHKIIEYLFYQVNDEILEVERVRRIVTEHEYLLDEKEKELLKKELSLNELSAMLYSQMTKLHDLEIERDKERKGRQQAEKQLAKMKDGLLEAARQLKNSGVPLDEVARITKLPKTVIRKL